MSVQKKRTRAKFLPEEDEKLRQLVAEFGLHAWDAIAERMPGRNQRQVRERWKHYLSGEKTHEPWTKEEDELLFEKVHELGGKWTKIARFLNGRTDLQAKLRWQKVFSGKSRCYKNQEETIAGRFVAKKQSDVEPPALVEADPAPVQLYTEIFDPDDADKEVDLFMDGGVDIWSTPFTDYYDLQF